MAFPDPVVFESWLRATGRCECNDSSHGHEGRCGRWLGITRRGKKGERAWEVRSKSPEGPHEVHNCEIICWDCLQKGSSNGG